MNALKAWSVLRGYKRHAGAIMALVPLALQLFGIENEQTTSIYKAFESLGTIVFGIGWVDRGAVAIKESLDAKEN